MPGYWTEATVVGESLQFILIAVDALRNTTNLGDWRYLAQTPSTFGAVGFDSPGTIDNSAWQCERVEATCKVHPTCGRIAAQMLAYPWGGHRKYSPDWLGRIVNWVNEKVGSFDNDGFHSFCHTPGSGHCWSYTFCLEEMLKWLCHADETADHCCPNLIVREACKNSPNSNECQVCVPHPAPDNIPAQPTQLRLPEWVPKVEPKIVPQSILRWLHPTAEDEAQNVMIEEEEKLAKKCQICSVLKNMKQPAQGDAIWWLLVSVKEVCNDNIMLCGQICGLYTGEGPFKEPDEMDNCEGWTKQCNELCPNSLITH